MCLCFTWQASHLATSICVLCGSLAFCVAGVALMDLWHWAGSGGALGLGLVAGDAAALCVAGVALGDMCLPYTWQVWHLATSTCVLRGRRGTYGTGLALVWQALSLSHAIFVTQHLSHTIFHTQLCHTPSFTHNFVTHHLSHATLSHTIFHTPLCHPPSLTHHLSHTTLSHTIFDPQLCHTPSFTHHFVTHHL